MLVCGVDGCPGGWVAASRKIGDLDFEFSLHRRFAELVHGVGRSALVVVDIPVGLTAAGARECDRAARQFLGRPRASSVFSAPIRPALKARTWQQACRIRERVERKRYQRQSFGIFAKVREVDTLLRAEPRHQKRVREAHPEVTFAAMNGGLGMTHPKKSRAGRGERLAAIERCLGSGAVAAYEKACAEFPREKVGRDDLLDALALVWTAQRIADGGHVMLPERAERDPMGLRMNIHY